MTNRKKNTLEASMQRLTVLTFLLVLAVAGPAWSVPEIMTEYGDQMPWFGADINAMGGTATALSRGGMSNIFNPAFLGAEGNNRLDVGGVLTQEHEDRFQPLYDTFNNWVAEVSIASNRNNYWHSGFGLVLNDSTAGLPMAIGLSLADRYPYSYTFTEEVRDPFYGSNPRDSILEDRERKVTGTLRDLSLGLGLDALDWLSLGAAAHYAFGTRTETNTQRFYTGDQDGQTSSYDLDVDGVNFTLGARIKASDRVEFGLAYEASLTARGTGTGNYQEIWDDPTNNVTETATNDDAYYRYPEIYRGGFTFYPRTDPKTVFTMEMEYIPWQKFEDSRWADTGDKPNLEHTVDVRIGLQHTFYNGVPLRFGFRHFPSYFDRDASSTNFTAGTGIPFGQGMFGVSLELSKITSFQPHQFPYPDGYYVDPESRVEDTRFRIGLSYTLNW